jgi:cytochrome P450
MTAAHQPSPYPVLSNSVVALLKHPRQLALLRDRPELTADAVEELLRYVPTAVASPTRIALEDVRIGGHTIPAGDAVITVERSANRDPAAFTEPDRLDVARTDSPPHVGFGHGIHYCLGAGLARIELQTAPAALLARFPTPEAAVALEELRWTPDSILYRPLELPVRW